MFLLPTFVSEHPLPAVICAVVGAVALVRFALSVFLTFVDRLRGGSRIARYKGQWAVVTGASYGIGAQYAKQLASKGLNVVLVARTESKLREVEAEIREKYQGVKTQVYPFDFDLASDADWARLTKTLVDLKPAVLVNNVGVATDMPEPVADTDPKRIDSMIRVNCLTTARMTHRLLPGMLERRAGAIIFLSSGSGLFPTPLLSVYGATKAFDNHFALSLRGELAGSGVEVQSVTPFFVVSEMSKVRWAWWLEWL